jgi:hypothetical protein
MGIGEAGKPASGGVQQILDQAFSVLQAVPLAGVLPQNGFFAEVGIDNGHDIADGMDVGIKNRTGGEICHNGGIPGETVDEKILSADRAVQKYIVIKVYKML